MPAKAADKAVPQLPAPMMAIDDMESETSLAIIRDIRRDKRFRSYCNFTDEPSDADLEIVLLPTAVLEETR
jgi:hypothetical protein